MSCGQRLAEQLRQSGFRVTPQRRVILEEIAHRGGHLAAHQVFDQASRRLPGLNVATVYRTLESLHRAGLLDMLDAGGEPARFALHQGSTPHAHLVCRRCGAVLETGPAAFERLGREIRRETGFEADTSHLALTGLCRPCQEAGGT